MSLDFVNTQNNPNLTNPGASFTEAFQGAQGRAIQQQQLAQQKQLAMAQMAQQQSQFNVTSELQRQQNAQAGAKNMADIAMMGAQTKLVGIQSQQTQFQADMAPKVAANNAYISNLMAHPDSFDFDTGPQHVQDGLSKVPFPDALTPTEADATVAATRTRNAQSSLGIAKQNTLATNLNTIGQAMQSVPTYKSFKIDPNGPDTPDNYNMPALGEAVVTAKKSMTEFGTEQDIKKIQAQGQERLDYANALTQGRQSTGWERTMAQNYKTASSTYDQMVKSGATQDQISAAKADKDKWENMIDTYRTSNGDGANSPNGGSMQNPSGIPSANPAKSFFQSIMPSASSSPVPSLGNAPGD